MNSWGYPLKKKKKDFLVFKLSNQIKTKPNRKTHSMSKCQFVNKHKKK